MVLEYEQMYSSYEIIYIYIILYICIKSICNNFKVSIYYALHDREVGTHVKKIENRKSWKTAMVLKYVEISYVLLHIILFSTVML